MRIAYVLTRADAVGGASIHVRDMAAAAQARGHEVLVLLGGEGPVTWQLKRAGVPYRSLRHLRRAIDPVRDALAFGELVRALRDWAPGLVSTHTAKAGWIGRAAAARLGLPAIYTPHGLAAGDRIGSAAGVVFTAAERIAARWARAIVCVSEAEKRLALSRRIAPPEKLRVIHNGVHDVAPELRAHPERPPVRIVSVARLERPKDHESLLRALASIRNLDWQLDLIGDGPLEPRLRKLAARRGLRLRVRFLGYQPDPAPALAAASLFVLSSSSEGFPRSILEAMRAGLPVVASDVGGIGEAVVHGATGLLVPRRSVHCLAGALADLVSDPTRRQRMGAAARQSYQARFRFEQAAEKTMAVYDKVLRTSASSGKA